MQDMQDMMRRLNQSGKRLSKGHHKIAEYIVEHYEKEIYMLKSIRFICLLLYRESVMNL